jgi:hypothetical protein
MTTNDSVDALLALRAELMDFIRQTLIDGRALELGHSQPRLQLQAFDDDRWRHSPLFRVITTSRRAESQWVRMRDAVLRSIWSRVGDPYADQEAHEHREQIGQRWTLIGLLALLMEPVFMQQLHLGAAAHMFRAFPLRVMRPVTNPLARYLPRDLGPSAGPIRWTFGPLSVLWVYGAYLAAALCNDTFVRRLAIPPGLGERLRGVEDKLLELTRRRLRAARDRTVAFIEERLHFLQPGDLLLADGLVTGLLGSPMASWEQISPLVRLSPISRLCRGRELLKLAGSDMALRLGLRPNNTARLQPELTCLVRTDELPGVHHRLAQALADVCQPGTPEVLREEAATAMRWLADDTYQRLSVAGARPEDGDYWVGLLILRVYRLCRRDGTLERIATDSPQDFMLGLNRMHALALLFDATDPQGEPTGSGWRSWLSPDNQQEFKELYHAGIC